MNKKLILLALLIMAVGLFFRLYHIEFGLPHSFYADEPEFTELAIRYTYDIKKIIANHDYYQLIPISYVYGTLPVYFLTASLMGFSKSLNLLHIAFDKTTMFIFFRVLTALISLGVVLAAGILAKKNFDDPEANNKSTYKIYLLTLLFTALNWKLIVHAHYVNADIILTLLLLVSFYWLKLYTLVPNNRNLFISAIFFGLAVGTKITALISLPLVFYLIWKKRDIYGFPGFILSAGISFIVTNPFSLVFFNDFSFRIYEMLFKEGGLVFDSVDYSPFKYGTALISMITFPVLLIAVYGVIRRLKTASEKSFDIFLILNILFYFVFLSVQSRRVDRWLLPILPIILMYAAYGFYNLLNLNRKLFYKIALTTLVFGVYLANPILLLGQFRRWTPKSEAYIWAKANLPQTKTKLGYTEEGLDPMNKIPLAQIYQFQVYTPEGAQFFYPENPLLYDYIILSSRPMENFKRPDVIKAFPEYAKRWADFEKTVENPKYFELIKDFSLEKPNLIPLSDVFIYKRLLVI